MENKPIFWTRKGVYAYKKCPSWLKKKYREAVNFICQICEEHELVVGKLIPHRIIRANEGGMYTVCPINSKSSNIKVICQECHKKIHSQEW